ncbi:MAG: hypothetical protein WC773_02875 [Patescibacteria group bacterium]|jgi:hypothetical protein
MGNSIVKKTALVFLLALSSFISFYGLHAALNGHYYSLILTFLVMPLCFGIVTVLLDDWVFNIFAVILSSAILLLFVPFNLYILLGTVLLAILMYVGISTSIRTKQFYIKPQVDQIANKSLSLLFWGLAVVIAVVSYSAPQVQNLKNGINIPYKYEVKIIQMVVPSFNPNLTVNQTINVLANQPIDAELPADVRQELLDKLGIGDLNLTGNETINERPDIITTIIGSKEKEIISGVGRYLPLTVAYIMFSLAVFVGKIALQLVLVLNSLIIYLLKKMNFYSLQKITVEQEKIVL